MQEIVSLVEHGCKVIQLDEPVLMRHPQVKNGGAKFLKDGLQAKGEHRHIRTSIRTGAYQVG